MLAALIRAGSGDSLVDNWCSGGSIIGVDKETGKLNSWALSNDRTRISTLSNGLRLDENELYIPNYERVIPENQAHAFQIQKSDLVEALQRVSQMVDKRVGRIYFTVMDGILKITSQESDLGSADEEIPCQYAGESCTIALNFRYIDEPLKVIDSERITFEFTEEMKAVTMRPEPAADYFHIIMPMSKSDN